MKCFPFVLKRSKRIENSGNLIKKHTEEDIHNLIIGGQDTCQGDSGGPLWVEEDGVGLTIMNDTDPEESFVSTFSVFSHFGWAGCQGKRLC